MVDTNERPFDIILYGATGFAGKLVAEYLARKNPDIDWAIAGRNAEKLGATKRDLVEQFPDVADISTVIADSLDRESLDELASQTRVVCTTVGPYAKYGDELVAACVEHGTDYCDLTGEVHWIRKMMDRHHAAAQESGARIVNCCGFDSIPSDLGTLMLQDFAEEHYDAKCDEVKFFLRGASGGFSGGTIDSMANLMEQAGKDPEIRKIVGHPYSLNPPGERKGPDGSLQQGPRYDEDIESWTGPFVMASVNEKIVRRSNALRDFEYGRDFKYSESVKLGSGVKGALSAGGMSAFMGGFAGAMAIKPTRKLLQRFVLPAPGEGPSQEDRENGYFKVELLGKGIAGDGWSFRVNGEVEADKDPGYGATAVMLGESALCLAQDVIEDAPSGGILTPASAMGMRLVERLREAGMTFDVREA
ncbi:MAG: saccharopine dehydrogenase family protein [Myxococcota bacterium]